MSHGKPVDLVLEWSPSGITAFDALSGRTEKYGLTDSLPYGGREAVLAIARRSIFVRTTRVPNASHDEVAMILRMRLGELVPLSATDIAYDFALADDTNAEGRLAMVAAMSATDLRTAQAAVTSQGIKIVKTIPVAVGATLLAEKVQAPDAVVYELESEYASIDLVHGGVVHVSRVISPNANPGLEISRTLSVNGFPCVPTIASSALITDADFPTESKSLAAIATVPSDHFKLNLELPEVVAARATKERNQRQRSTALMTLAAVALSFYVYSDRSDAADAVDKAETKYKSLLKKVKTAQSVAENDANKVIAIQGSLRQAFEPAQHASDILAVVTNLVPKGAWLGGYSFERGKVLTLRGTAQTSAAVTKFLDALNKEPRFRDAKLAFANNAVIEKVPVIQFSISAFPVGNLPIVKLNTKKSSAAPAATTGVTK